MEKLESIKTRFQKLPKKKKMKALQIIIIIVVSISLFASSMAIKNEFSLLYERIDDDPSSGLNFDWDRGNETWHFESYADSWWYYEPYLLHFRYMNWNPYAGGEGPLNGYAYGPMFVYGLYFISLFVSMANPGVDTAEIVKESVKWTHITFDALCVVMVYLIIVLLESYKEKKLKGQVFGFVSATIFAFMPINLLYVDSIFLNTPQMTFFTLLSLLFMMKDKYMAGAFFLAVAWLTKQMPLFLLIPWFMVVWKKKSLKDAFLRYLLPFLLTTIIISLPWIFMTPKSYLWRVFGPGRPLDFVTLGQDQYTVTLAHSFLYLGNEGLANFYVTINKYMIPFLLFYLIATVFSYFNGKKIGNSESLQIIFATWIIINTHLFISRGVYKYYNAFITPFVLLSVLTFTDENVRLLFKKIWNRGKSDKKDSSNENYDLEEIDFEDELTGSRRTNYRIVTFIVSFFSFLVLSAAFVYFNLVLITDVRYMHPIYLLILFVVFSILLPPSLYVSLGKKSNYVMIKDDVVYIAKETYTGIKQAATNTQTTTNNIYKKTKDKMMNFFTKNGEEEKLS